MIKNNKNKKRKMISTKYEAENPINDYIEGFTDEEGTGIRNNDDLNKYEYIMRMFPNPDW